jgi:hypothetical protein
LESRHRRLFAQVWKNDGGQVDIVPALTGDGLRIEGLFGKLPRALTHRIDSDGLFESSLMKR